MQPSSKTETIKILITGIALACAVTACGSSEVNAPVVGAVAAQATAVTPELKEMRHRRSECPRSIEGVWTTRTQSGAPVDLTYRFEGPALIEQASNRSAADRMVYDGRIHQLPDEGGMRFWYVGACQNKMAISQMWSTNGTQVVKIDAMVVNRRGGRLGVGNELNGYKIPFMHIYERKNLENPN